MLERSIAAIVADGGQVSIAWEFVAFVLITCAEVCIRR